MNKTEIGNKLTENYQAFVDLLMTLDQSQFEDSINDKWSAGRQLDHLVRSVNPLAIGLIFPPFVLQMFWGKANRPSRTMDEVVAKYQSKLSAGGKASGQFIPKVIPISRRKQHSERLLRIVQKLIGRLHKLSEQQIDTLIVPHPLLGKMTFREMMMFTIYHVEHHRKSIIKNLNLAPT